jgi:hypothetical protein
MAKQQTQPQTPRIAAAPADLKTLGSAFTASSTQLVSSGATMSAQVQSARLAGLKRAATAAAAAYGTQSKEATKASAAVAVAQARAGQLQVATQKISTPTPTVASTGWALHGRVYDASQNPQDRYTVFLVDAQKNYLREYGFSYTDATGYFLLNYSGPAEQSSSDAAAGASAASSKSKAATSDSPTATEKVDQETTSGADDGDAAEASVSSTPPPVYLQVYDAKANPVISSNSPVTPVTGQARYHVLTVPTAKQTLGDPPAEVRAVASPPVTAAESGNTKQKAAVKKTTVKKADAKTKS